MNDLITLSMGVVSVEDAQTALMHQITPEREAEIIQRLFRDVIGKNPSLASATLQCIEAEWFDALLNPPAWRRPLNPAILRPDVVIDPS